MDTLKFIIIAINLLSQQGKVKPVQKSKSTWSLYRMHLRL